MTTKCHNTVAQTSKSTSKSAVSQVSKPAGRCGRGGPGIAWSLFVVRRSVDLEIGDTARMKSCATNACRNCGKSGKSGKIPHISHLKNGRFPEFPTLASSKIFKKSPISRISRISHQISKKTGRSFLSRLHVHLGRFVVPICGLLSVHQKTHSNTLRTHSKHPKTRYDTSPPLPEFVRSVTYV